MNVPFLDLRAQHAPIKEEILTAWSNILDTCGFVNGLPVGLQIIGRPNEEDLVLRASRQYEKALNWNARHPEGEMDLAS